MFKGLCQKLPLFSLCNTHCIITRWHKPDGWHHENKINQSGIHTSDYNLHPFSDGYEAFQLKYPLYTSATMNKLGTESPFFISKRQRRLILVVVKCICPLILDEEIETVEVMNHFRGLKLLGLSKEPERRFEKSPATRYSWQWRQFGFLFFDF